MGVTELAFHFGAPDKLAYTCRLLRKAAGSGAHVTVVGSATTLQHLDGALWALSATDFVPHCWSDAPSRLLNHTPVVLAREFDTNASRRGVLVNLTDDVPAGFDAFERLIEVVSQDVADRELARQRWRHYTAQGYAIVRHDLNLKTNT